MGRWVGGSVGRWVGGSVEYAYVSECMGYAIAPNLAAIRGSGPHNLLSTR